MFYRGSCVFFRTISLPSFNGLCCKLAEITLFICMMQGRSQDFSRGGGGNTVSKWGYSPDCHYGQGIVMAFSPPVLGCLVKKGLQKGGSWAPQTPLATPL